MSFCMSLSWDSMRCIFASTNHVSLDQSITNLERCLPALILVKEPHADGWGIYSETEDSETSLGVYPKVLNWLSKSSFGF